MNILPVWPVKASGSLFMKALVFPREKQRFIMNGSSSGGRAGGAGNRKVASSIPGLVSKCP